jgi:SOS-response transcriptional repressor LexA
MKLTSLPPLAGSLDLTIDPAQLGEQGGLDSGAPALPDQHPSDVRSPVLPEPETLRDSGAQASHKPGLQNVRRINNRIHVICGRPPVALNTPIVTTGVVTPAREKLRAPVKVSPDSISAKVRALRGERSQQYLADRIGISQAAIDKIEKGGNASAQTLIALGNIAGEPDCWAFWGAAGMDIDKLLDRAMSKQKERVGGSHTRQRAISGTEVASMDFVEVPLLKDAAAAGTPRLIDERLIEERLPMPRAFCPHPEHTTCIHVVGDSMSPILEDGYIVAIDAFSVDIPYLYNRMVAAIDPEGGVTIKWLRRSGKVDLLVPQHVSQRHSPLVITGEPGWQIIGRVAWWLGLPAPMRRSA